MRKLLLASLLLTSAAPAFADPTTPPDVSKMAGDDCARARKAGKTCVLDMGAIAVEGDKPGAGNIGLTLINFGGAGSLIKIRTDFIPEILKTAEDID